MTRIKVFKYLDKYDAFDVTDEFRSINGRLGLAEWTPVVWITRLLCMDNDYGEHVFDNWSEREFLEKKFGLDKNQSHELLIVVPSRFEDGADGPCNGDDFRKRFWTDVFKSLELDLETIFVKARDNNDEWKRDLDETPSYTLAQKRYKPDLETLIEEIRQEYDTQT